MFSTAAGRGTVLVAPQEGPGCFGALLFHLFMSTKQRHSEGSAITTALYSGVHQPSPQGKWLNASTTAKLSTTADLQENNSISTVGF